VQRKKVRKKEKKKKKNEKKKKREIGTKCNVIWEPPKLKENMTMETNKRYLGQRMLAIADAQTHRVTTIPHAPG
jgi:hypothetical protein